MKKQVTFHDGVASRLHDIILGGQDGVVNVLGLVLGVASATNDPKIVIIAGLASTFAESISMGAVAYTSSEAENDYLTSIHKKFDAIHSPLSSALIVLFASFIGSVIPIVPFFVVPVQTAMWSALVICSAVLFATGALKARLTVGNWFNSGLRMMLVGILSAVAGYLIGHWLGVLL
ncbi:MAG TPA: VIT1/CCC1 transporter family protein [Candidatus Binatia bacterium]|nr:VIT1/CCC1 transporter family protein [Candidatus Binatia bacterium]